MLTTTVFTEGFESGFPGVAWTVNTNLSRNWDDTNYKAHGGNSSGFCSEYQNLDNTHTYVNSLDTYMERTVNLSGYTSASLSFWDWENTEPNADYLRLKVNGTQEFYRSNDPASWSLHTIDLKTYAGLNSVTIRFEFTSDASVVPTGDAGACVLRP